MPLGAFVLSSLLRLDQPLGVGLLLLGTSAGAPFLPKLAEIAKGNQAFAVGLMVLLMVLTIGYLPLALPLFLQGVSVNPAKIARSLVLLMLLPLGAGLVLKVRYEETAARTKPLLDRISSLSLVLLVLLFSAANIGNLLDVFGTRGILTGVLFVAWLRHRVVPRRAGCRNEEGSGPGHGATQYAAALVIGSQSFDDPRVVVMVIVVAIIGFLILMPLSRALARRFSAVRR